MSGSTLTRPKSKGASQTSRIPIGMVPAEVLKKPSGSRGPGSPTTALFEIEN